MKLHEAGVTHGDVARRNFVRGPKGIRLIDFDRASHHVCPRSSVAVPVPRDVVSGQECAELEKLYCRFGLYLTETVDASKEGFVLWDGRPWGEDAVPEPR